MPRETRQIILSDEELLQAIRSYRRVRPAVLPQGDILSTSLETIEGGHTRLNVVVQMRYGTSQLEAVIGLQEADLLALLIRFCLENNVPVPRRGEKSVASMDGEVALLVSFATNLASPEEA